MKSPMRDFGPGLGEVPIDHLTWPCIEQARVYADPLEVLQIRYADAEARHIYLFIYI